MALAGALPAAALELLAALDLEELKDRLLAALAAAADAQGAALWVADEGGALALRALRGLVDGGALPARLDPAEPSGRALAGPLRAGQPFRAPELAGGDGLLVPLVHAGEVVGLALLDPGRGGRAVAELVPPAALALRNARRVRALERATLRDPGSGAYRAEALLDYAAKELSRARRYGRSASLALVALDAPEPPRALAAAVARAARDTDVLAADGEGAQLVLLPDTDPAGARIFERRAAEEIRRDPALRPLREGLALGAASFPEDGDELEDLLAVCRARLAEDRASPLRRLPAALRDAPGAFWELCDALLAGAGEAAGPSGVRSARLPADPELLAAAERELARELTRDPRARAALYVARAGAAASPALAALPPLEASARTGDLGARIFLLGTRRAPGGGVHPLVTEVAAAGDRRLEEDAFLLFLSGRAAYALLRAGGGMFHTSDPSVVDALIAKLQARYDLAPL